MNKILSNAAVGAGSLVVALATVATVGAAVDDALYNDGSAAFTRGKLTVSKGDLVSEYPVRVDSNEVIFKGIKTSGTKFPVIDFGTGGTKITSEANRQLTIKADDILHLNPANGVEIGGGRKIGFNGTGGTIELFSAGGLNTAEIIGHNDGEVTITSHKGVKVTAQKGLQIGASRQYGTKGNGVVTNTLELGTAQDENVAIVRTFVAAVALSPGDVVVLDETDTGRNDRSFRVTTTTTADDDATIGVVVNDNAVGVGAPVKVAIAGVAKVTIQGAVTMGAELATSTTAGRAATTTVAPTATAMSLGIALENGSHTGKVAVLIDKR